MKYSHVHQLIFFSNQITHIPMKPIEHKKHYEGHRQRLKEKLLNNPEFTFHDYEILELILFRTIPRKDTKPLAKNLISSFGTLVEVLNAPIENLRKIEGCGENVAMDLKLIGMTVKRASLMQLTKRNILSSWDRVEAYCKSIMAFETKEVFYVLFLDNKNNLISSELLQHGSINQILISPRDVIERALALKASSIILSHNHPSGDPSPSIEDIDTTNKIVAAAKLFDIPVHDHIIVGRHNVFSLRANKLIIF